MLIIDAHEDIGYNALEWGRYIRASAYTTREREREQPEIAGQYGAGGLAMNGLPDLRRGGVGIVCGVIFTLTLTAAQDGSDKHTQSYRSAEEAYQAGQQQLAYYQELRPELG